VVIFYWGGTVTVSFVKNGETSVDNAGCIAYGSFAGTGILY
jgi:hypothetical protein